MQILYICIYIKSADWLACLRARLLACSLPGLLGCWLGVLACLLLLAHLPACWHAGCLAYVLARLRACSIGYLLAGMVACSLARLIALVAGLLACLLATS